MSTNTIRLHRVLRATPERIYRAFLDADAMAKWLPPNGFTGKVHHLEAKVGGTHKMSFTNFTTGHSHSFGGTYLELVPHERLRYTDEFDDPNLPGELQVTVTCNRVTSRLLAESPLLAPRAIKVGATRKEASAYYSKRSPTTSMQAIQRYTSLLRPMRRTSPKSFCRRERTLVPETV